MNAALHRNRIIQELNATAEAAGLPSYTELARLVRHLNTDNPMNATYIERLTDQIPLGGELLAEYTYIVKLQSAARVMDVRVRPDTDLAGTFKAWDKLKGFVLIEGHRWVVLDRKVIA